MEGTVGVGGIAPCGAKLAEAMGFANFVETKMVASSAKFTVVSMCEHTRIYRSRNPPKSFLLKAKRNSSIT